MKIKILFTMLLVISNSIYSQGLTGTASGNNSIMIGANNINVNITDPSINISLNNLDSSIGIKKKIIYGVSATGKNESKFSDIFSKGNLASSAKANLFLGFSLLPDYKKYNEYNSGLEEIVKKRLTLEKEIEEKYVNEIRFFFQNERDVSTQNVEKTLFENLINQLDENKTEEEVLQTINKSDTSEEFKRKINDSLKAISTKRTTELNTSESKLTIEQQTLTENFLNSPYQQFKAFAFGGINALEFKRFIGWNDVNLSDSFADEYFRGGNFGIGTNYQRKNWMIGVSYQYLYTNNFALLSSKDYSSKVVQSQNNQSITQEKKITAYTGNYGSFRLNQLFADVIYNLSLDKSKNYFVLINPYFNAQIFSGNKDIYPDNFNIGSGFYLFNSKRNFLGGFYTQLNDIGNKFEKLKPIDEQNLRPTFKRITFGLVATYSFNSIFPERKL